ncbi:hypothetical protein ASPACDRAFT_64959 [Aspergillus aculeatus ATCC 16872]|uniref:Uncharacterized protein n=1 Tax=Aspergillus aculeatus (strain ATCC 16872 / CBS 172.66 / WB 5094) TaxID=690307 RepID=A0A1L9WF66_ASPA1|nr:uncharacterized protein ASPACDRAFT_64959 [Aspergillus aculeatus ATCC 16872]OJJ94809.1 hypothetical protein ASPACDRAFT_64959 [Aspergillus aculeatus ATCC 16872]
MHKLTSSLDPLYSSGGKGSMRYFFLHGGYSRLPFPDTEVSVEAKVLVFNGHGKIVFDHSTDGPTSQYRFINRALVSVDDRQDAYVPAGTFVETLLKNISIPTLLFAEIPRWVLLGFNVWDQVIAGETEEDSQFLYVVLVTLGRTGLDQASFQDYEYLKSMLHSFVPRFATVVSQISDAYLPGDARNLSDQIAGLMMPDPAAEETKDLRAFLTLYAKRYVHEALRAEEILKRCLMHMVKMPFELESSIRYGLIVN